MPNTTNYSVPTQGMVTDLHQFNTENKHYFFALNAMVSDKFGGNEAMLQNEGSNLCSVEFPPNYQVVGFKEIPEQKRVIYFLHNTTTGISQIGEVRDCQYKEGTDKINKVFCTTCPEYSGEEIPPLEKRQEHCYCSYRIITSSSCLNFNVNYPVDIEYRITSCGVNLYFTDNFNERRYLSLDYENGSTLDDLVLSNSFKVVSGTSAICECPEGSTLNEETGLCETVTFTPVTPSGDQRVACKANSTSWGDFGVQIYSTYNTNGTGSSSLHHVFDTYWSNVGGAPNQTGALNRVGLWACNDDGTPQSGEMLPVSEYIGFIFPVDVTETTTYYIGIGADNTVRIRLDCQDILVMDPMALADQYPSAGISAAFKYWHIYPIVIPAGHHVIELTGLNYGSVAGFGAEIYDNTAAEIIAATNGSGLNTIFSTLDYVGLPLQVSSTFSGTCADGSCLDINEEGELVCSTTEVSEPICGNCEVEVYEDEIDCEKIKVHRNYTKPCVVAHEFVNGGGLKAGVYQVLIAYSDPYGNPITTYFPASQTIPLFEKEITFDTNYITNKALSFSVEGLFNNDLYQYYNIVIAQTIERFTEFLYVGTFSTTQKSYVYTGLNNNIVRLDEQAVLFKRPFYKTASGVTKANNYLFYTDVKEYRTFNLQPFVNAIELQWETVALKEQAYKKALNTFNFHTYQRDEVYPFGIIFEFDNGRETCVFHIPGRKATEFDLDIIDNNDVLPITECGGELRNKRWQVYNTGNVIGGDYNYNENCEIDNCWEYGSFAYWESTEVYPNVPEVWGELCGEPIRHHKFPDSCITHIHDGLNTSKAYSENNYIFPIGVRINHQSVLNALAQAVVSGAITQLERDSIVSYRIVRGNRVANKSIDAKGLLFNMLSYGKYGKTYHFANYSYNDLHISGGDDAFLKGVSLSPQRYTFHSPDVHFVNSGLGNILKVETEEYGKSEGYFTFSECQAKHKIVSAFAITLAFGLGLAAALSATGEKTCKVVTYTSPQTVSEAEFDAGVSGQLLGMGSGTITSGGGSIGGHAITNNTTDGGTIGFGGMSGVNTNTPLSGNPITVPDYSSEQVTFCKGSPYQIFDNPIEYTQDPAALVLLTPISTAYKYIQRVFLGYMEMQKFVDTIRALIGYKNHSVQYNSVGKYNNYICVGQGNKVRLLDKSAYLEPIIQDVDEPSTNPSSLYETISINNWNRESSVYLKTSSALSNPTKNDNSKVSMTMLGSGYNNVDDLNKKFNRDIASYYVSVKRNVLNQYGQICNIDYLETNSCSFFLNRTYTTCEAKVFGGDTFINRFALKRKIPFFIRTECNLPNDSDVLYKELGNVATPIYFFNTPEPYFQRISNVLDLLTSMFSDNEANYDGTGGGSFFSQGGVIPLFSYGVPYFFVESDINVDYRHGQDNREKDFYPHNTDLKNWFEEEHVPIATDNYYFYNRTYSKQNHESVKCVGCIKNIKELTCLNNVFNRLIYSEPTITENKNDNWLIFKANNYYDFDSTKGRLISADGIENDKVLVRLEKGTQIFSAYDVIQTTGENIQVGSGGMFQSRPQDISVTDLGYAGTQHRDILHTEYGHLWADAERGQIFNLSVGGNGIDEITKYGHRSWFKENLPFQISKDFTNISQEDLDNNLNGLGLHYCFDKRYNRVLITKLDYKKINQDVAYNKETKTFYILVNNVQVPVDLKNTKYFCNKSWTISYNFLLKTWTSYHSYTPNFYVEYIDKFDSSFKRGNVQKMYSHNVTNKSYQVFYGKLFPFIVEFQANQSLVNNTVNSVEYYLDVIRYHNEFDTFYNRKLTFNKGILYNESQVSSPLVFHVSDPEDMTEILEYPKRTQDGYEVLTTNSENVWRFNDFWDASKKQFNNVPIFNYDCNNVNKQVNYKAIDNNKDDFDRPLLRQRMCRVRLTNDKESNYHFIFGFGQINQRQSFR